MKHTGNAASLQPARQQARARERRDGRRPPRTTGRPTAPGADWIGAWRLDVNTLGDLVAINEDTGAERLLAEKEEDS